MALALIVWAAVALVTVGAIALAQHTHPERYTTNAPTIEE